MKRVLFNSDVINSVTSFFFRLDSLVLMQVDLDKSKSMHDNLDSAINAMRDQGYERLDLYLSLPLKGLFEAECRALSGELAGITQTVEGNFPMINSVTWTIPNYLKDHCRI